MKFFRTFLCMVLLATGGGTAGFASEPRRYVSEPGGYHIQVPEGWSVEILGDGDDIAITSPPESAQDRHFENLQVWTDLQVEPKDLDTYFRHSLERFAQTKQHFDLKEEGARTFVVEYRGERTDKELERSSVPAKMFRAVIKDGGVTAEIMQYQLQFEGRVYILSLAATPESFDRHAKLFADMVNSFTVVRYLADYRKDGQSRN